MANLKQGINQLVEEAEKYPIGIRSNNFANRGKSLERAKNGASHDSQMRSDVREGQNQKTLPGGVRDWMRKNHPDEFQTKNISPTAKFKDYPVNGYRNDEAVTRPGKYLDTVPSENIADEAERRKINQLVKKGVIKNKNDIKRLKASINWRNEPEMWERLQKGESADSILADLSK